MNKNVRSSLVVGILLIIAGLLFILFQAVPSLRALVNQANSWVLIIEAVAFFLLLLGIFLRVPEMAVPAAIVAGIGGILFYQASTGNWESWSYLWTLIPGFVGVGMLAGYLLGGQSRYQLGAAFDTIGSSLILFAIFGAIFGGFRFLGIYWPLVLVAAGVLVFIRRLVRKH